MANYNYYTPNQYADPTCYYWCPVMQKYYRTYQPNHYDFNHITPENPPMHREYMSGYSNYNNNDNNQMSNPEINKVVTMVKKEHKSLLQSIQQFIADTKLLNYLLAALITYICKNYNKYKDVIDEKTDELVEDMKRNLPWVFDILAVFDITPEMVDDFLDNLIRATVMGIRKLLPNEY
jgi:hypothetical protein